MSRRRMITTLIIMLAIGFASISTTLIINANLNVATNKNDFSIIFTNVKLNGTARNDFVDETKTVIDFETNELTKINQVANIDYEVTNTSLQYDGSVSIKCNPINSEYLEMTYSPTSMIVEAGKSKTGNIKVKLKKSSVESQSVRLTCTLDATATERDTFGIDYSNPRSKILTTFLEGKYIWDPSISNNVTKVIFENQLMPRETKQELKMDVSEAQNRTVMAYAVENGESTEENKRYDLYIQADGKVIANEESSYLFNNFTNLKSIEGLEYLDTSNVINMVYMFRNCKSFSSLDLKDFDTSKVISMENMFRDCSGLSSLNISNFTTDKVRSMASMFNGCKSLTTLNLSNFTTTSAISMNGMFQGCSSLESLDLSNFITNNVTNMSGMFYGCSSLGTLNISNFVTNKVTSMYAMFFECKTLNNLFLTNFDTAIVTNMGDMFNGCRNLTELDLSNFITSNVSSMKNMFRDCSKLITLDISSFNTSNVTDMTSMFQNCINLTTSITIRGNKITAYSGMFANTATTEESGVTVNYTNETSTLVDSMIDTKSSNSNVTKGTLVA